MKSITKVRLQAIADEFGCEIEVTRKSARIFLEFINHDLNVDYGRYKPNGKWHWPKPDENTAIDTLVYFKNDKGYSLGYYKSITNDGFYSCSTHETITTLSIYTIKVLNSWRYCVLANPDDLSQVPTEKEQKEIERRKK